MKKLILAGLLAIGCFGAGFGSSSQEADITLENPFNGKQ